MAPPIYEISALAHSYGDKPVLSIEHLTVSPAAIVGLIGPNGSGKSTLLKLLGLIERPTRGRILFNGQPVGPFADKARFQISLLPQEPFLMKRSVFNNVAYGLKLRGNGGNLTARVNEALSLVGLNGKDFSSRPWYALSGGEAQRVALAARLALKPKVLLLDEPTTSVDAASAQLIKEASLRARQEWGTTLIVASHDWPWLYEICDHILPLFRGRVFGTGHETVVFGPWKKSGKTKWGKRLSDGQVLAVPEPPTRDAAAVIDVSVADTATPITGNDDIVLTGVVSRLSLEKRNQQIVATIVVGGLSLPVRLTPRQTDARTIFPGKTIQLRYRLDQVNWI